MARWPYSSRSAWSAATSAAIDRGAAADRIQGQLEADGWTVTRVVEPHTVTVLLTREAADGFAHDGGVYSGPTAVDALRLALSDKLNEEITG